MTTTDPFAMCLHWERELQKAIERRYRVPHGRNNQERRMYRKWLRHCRQCANDWSKQP